MIFPFAHDLYLTININQVIKIMQEPIEITTEEANQDIVSKKNEEYQLEEIVSERVTEEIEDDITSLRKKMNQTPLSFYVKLGQSYLISFNKKQVLSHLLKTFILAIFQLCIALFVDKVLAIPSAAKKCMIGLVCLNLLMFFLLFFVDPGTLFEDEEQSLQNQRIFCQSCHLYKNVSTHHCKSCVKCVKGYDHHCSFFGKCIGRRNIIIFAVFMMSMAAGGVVSMGGLVYSIIASI